MQRLFYDSVNICYRIKLIFAISAWLSVNQSEIQIDCSIANIFEFRWVGGPGEKIDQQKNGEKTH